MDASTALSIIAPFYDALKHPSTKDVAALIGSCTSGGWQSHSLDGAKSRDQFIAQVQGFGRGLPDLAFDIQEVLVAGDRIVVRSIASGTPVGDFMGIKHGGKSFRIGTIDIHTVVDGKLSSAQHVEDWASALRQLA